MKIKVSFRNVNAEIEFVALAKKQPKKPPKYKGFLEKYIFVDTVAGIKKQVVEELRGHPFEQLKDENIRVFEKEESIDDDEKKFQLVPVNLRDKLRHGVLYFCLEVFQRVPIDLLRTVRLDQLDPATLCLPNRRGFTDIAPFATAAMRTPNEDREPWYDLSDTGELCVHGISVFCEDTADSVDKGFNPFEEVAKGKNKRFKMTLKEYENLVPKKDCSRELLGGDTFGSLATPLTHFTSKEGGLLSKDNFRTSLPTFEKKDRPKEQATQQDLLFRFCLKKDTDLGKHGMSVVYDSMDMYHCSLVRENPPGELVSPWVQVRAHSSYLLLPEQKHSVEGIADDELIRLLSPGERTQPDSYLGRIGGRNFRFLPFLAAEFQLRDFVFDAKAEPLPLEIYDGDDAKCMYFAASILFSLTSEDDVYKAIRNLEAEDYVVGNIDSSDKKVLLQAMDKVDRSDMSDVDSCLVGLDNDIDLYDAFLDAIDALGRAMDLETRPAKTESEEGSSLQLGDTSEALDEMKNLHVATAPVSRTPYQAKIKPVQQTPSPLSKEGRTSTEKKTPDSHSSASTTQTAEPPDSSPLLGHKMSYSSEADELMYHADSTNEEVGSS